MKPENKAFLEANRTHWITLRDAFFIRHLDGHTRSEMQRIMGEEFRPGYVTDLWCQTCVADMVRALYQEFEKWEAAQPKPLLEPFIPTLPAEPILPPVQMKANFPSHKNRRR